ncbi:MAG: metallophosphoesterase, partial [Oscillospiraceae bacterium]
IFRRRFKKWVSLGMFFCLAGAFPFIIAQLSPEKNHNFISYASVAAFLPVGIGMFLISLHAVRFFSCGALAASRGKLKKETRFLMLVTAVYWSIVAAVYLTGSFITAKWGRTWIVWPVGMVGYGIVFLVCSFITGKWENQNISNRKRKRINLTVLFVTVFFGLWLMSMGSWYIQPYVSTVPIETRALDIDYDVDNGIYSITNEEGTDFRVLQLTDIHLGGSFFTQTKDLKALRAVYDLISYTKPDLVIVTGDLVYPIPLQTFSFNNYVPILQFATFMRNIGVPWAFVYGNHDTEFIATHTSDEINDILDDFSYTSNLNFLYNENPPKIYGRNNQLIEVLNPDGSVNQALFLFDSNEYKSRKLNDYDYIRDDQVDWYAELTREINEKEEKCVSSLLFFHIPLEQYKTAYDLYKAGSDEVQYFYGKVGERNEAISCSEHESKLFDTALSLESTKGIFVGHDHYNDISMGYKGIRLTYGKSIDFLAYPGIDKSDWQRGGTLITLHPDSSFDVEPVQLSGLRAS